MLSPRNMYHCLTLFTSKETFLGRVYKRGGRVVCALASESRGRPGPTVDDDRGHCVVLWVSHLTLTAFTSLSTRMHK